MSINKYDLVRSHIDDIRQSIREVSDDTNVTDEQIYKALLDARALILERRLKKGKQLPEYMYQEICMLLCMDKYHNCDCVPDEYECKVLKTKQEIPNGLYNGSTEILRVSTLWGKEIAESTEALLQFRKYRKTGGNNYYYSRTGGKLAIFNVPSNRLRAIKIRGIFVDPASALAISFCPDDEPNCVDVTMTGFGSAASDNLPIYELVMNKLLKSKQIPEDVSNDADANIPGRRI